MNYKFNIPFLILVLSITTNIVFSQQQDVTTNNKSIKDNHHSIELDLLDAISISYRYYFSSKWDAAINISYEGSYINERGNAISRSLNKESNSELTILINPKVNYRLINSSIVNLYLGCGLFFSYSNLFLDTFGNEMETHYNHIYENREFGTTASVQLDVDVIKNIKLFGKYNIFAGWGNESTNGIRTDEKNNKKFIELDKLTLGVGISF